MQVTTQTSGGLGLLSHFEFQQQSSGGQGRPTKCNCYIRYYDDDEKQEVYYQLQRKYGYGRATDIWLGGFTVHRSDSQWTPSSEQGFWRSHAYGYIGLQRITVNPFGFALQADYKGTESRWVSYAFKDSSITVNFQQYRGAIDFWIGYGILWIDFVQLTNVYTVSGVWQYDNWEIQPA